MDVIGAKVLAGFLFFFLAMFFGWMPLWCYKRCISKADAFRTGREIRPTKQSPFVQYLHSMAAGVLIATCLLSLLPESLEAVRGAMEKRQRSQRSQTDSSEISVPTNVATDNNDSGISLRKVNNISDTGDGEAGGSSIYPVAECLVALGFIFIYIIDTIIKSFQGDVDTQVNNPADNAHVQLDGNDHITQRAARPVRVGHSPEAAKWKKTRYEPLRQYDDGQEMLHDGHESRALPDSSVGNSDGDRRRQSMSGSESDSRDCLLSDMIGEIPETSVQGMQSTAGSNTLRSLALVAALCIHGFFDGVMLGLQTSQSVILSLLFALSVHKSFVAIGLSLTLMSTDERTAKYMLSYIVPFASVAPLGLLLSAAFVHKSFDTSDGQSVGIGPGCLQAFAVGTFMYVTFTETTERHHKRRRFVTEILSHVFLLTGFVLMAGLRAAIGDV